MFIGDEFFDDFYSAELRVNLLTNILKINSSHRWSAILTLILLFQLKQGGDRTHGRMCTPLKRSPQDNRLFF